MLPSRQPTERNRGLWLDQFRGEAGGLLPDYLIRALVEIEPFAEKSPAGAISYGLGHYGYDLRCGRQFKVFRPSPYNTVIDPKNLDPRSFEDFEGDVCFIPANSFALAVSLERFAIPREIIALVVDKSTLRRCGISMGATILEPEWQGQVTLEISNTTPLPVKIYAGEGLAQVLFFKGYRPCDTSYADKDGRYQNQQGIVLPFVTGPDRSS